MLPKTVVTTSQRPFFALGLLVFALLPIGCAPTPQPPSSESLEPALSEATATTLNADQSPTSPEAQPNQVSGQKNSNVQMGPGQKRYQSDRFSFTYPDSFELTVTHLENSTEEYITLLRQEDVSDSEPPLIGISVYENPQQLSLEDFREQRGYFILNEFPDIAVAGQRALDFESAGLYESREHLFKTPEGTHVVSLSSTYLDVISDTDPLWQVAQSLRDSFEWRSPSATANTATVAPVEPFTLDELFDQGAGGCGMSLLQPNPAPGDGFLFVHGVENTPALMKLDGQWVHLNRTEANGEEFYGQYTSQTFVSEDGNVTVHINVSLGEVGEIESIEFADVQFNVVQDNQTVDVPAIGGAGC